MQLLLHRAAQCSTAQYSWKALLTRVLPGTATIVCAWVQHVGHAGLLSCSK